MHVKMVVNINRNLFRVMTYCLSSLGRLAISTKEHLCCFFFVYDFHVVHFVLMNVHFYQHDEDENSFLFVRI